MAQLFDRFCALTIGLPGQPGRTYQGMRVFFDIEKTGESTSNKAKIDIYNLSALSRLQYQKADPSNLKSTYQIQLVAGYQSIKRAIYIGDIRTAKNARKSSDIITTFECGTAEKQLLLAKFDKSYPPGTKYVSIVQDLAIALQVDIGPVVGIQNQVYNGSFVASGSVKSSLDILLFKQGLQWSIQDGMLQIFPKNAHNGQSAVVVSNLATPGLTGLIGVPSQSQGITQFVSLLNPNIYPGRPVQIFSENIAGNFFRVTKAHIEGDTHDNAKWNMNCEALPIKATQTLPQNQGTNFSTAVTG